MSHKSIRLLIENTVSKLSDDIQYSYATETDFNQSKKKGSVLVNTAPMVAIPSYTVNGVQNFYQQWNVSMVFYKTDKSGEVDYVKLLDELDEYVDRFINDLNFFQEKSIYITLGSFNKTPFVKATADVLTGWLLTFQLNAMDDFSYCRDC